MRLFSRKTNPSVDHTAAQVAGELKKHFANMSDEANQGMQLLRAMAASKSNVSPDFKQGNLFEIIEATKFNINAAENRVNERAVLTANQGNPHAPGDVIVVDGEKIVMTAQMKSSGVKSAKDLARLTRSVSDPKYRGMQKVVNSENEIGVRELAQRAANRDNIHQADYQDTTKQVTGKLHTDKASSSGTSHSESYQAATNSKSYAMKFELKQYGKEIAVTAGTAATAGAVMGGGISAVKNITKYAAGDISGGEAVERTLKDTVKGAVRGGTTGAVGTGIRIGAQKAGLKSLAKSNIALTAASSMIDTGIVVYDFALGEITAEEAAERLGQNGASAISSIYTGAAAGAIFGPVGAVVGSIAGYMLATQVYQTAIGILRNANLSEEMAAKLIALATEARLQMKAERLIFEEKVKEAVETRRNIYSKALRVIDYGLMHNDYDKVTVAFSKLMLDVGIKLKLLDFEEFARIMNDKNSLLEL